MSGICDSGTVSAKFQQGTETFGRRFLRGFRNAGSKDGESSRGTCLWRSGFLPRSDRQCQKSCSASESYRFWRGWPRCNRYGADWSGSGHSSVFYSRGQIDRSGSLSFKRDRRWCTGRVSAVVYQTVLCRNTFYSARTHGRIWIRRKRPDLGLAVGTSWWKGIYSCTQKGTERAFSRAGA